MSDRPLFQNSDEQEAAYDPERRGADEALDPYATDPAAGTVVPGGAGAMTSGTLAGGTGSSSAIAGAGIGSTAPSLGDDDDDTTGTGST